MIHSVGRMLGAAVAVILVAAGVAQAKNLNEPATGVAFKPRTGVFAETQIGIFTTFGGSKTVSNGQPFLALSAGMDLGSMPELSLFVTAGMGFNADSCRAFEAQDFGGVTENVCATYDFDGQGTQLQVPQDFTIIPLEVGGRYKVTEFVPRLQLTVSGVAGFSFLTPQVTENNSLGSPHAGLGVGVVYATRLPGLDVGAEVMVRVAFSPLIPSLSAYPRIRYVF